MPDIASNSEALDCVWLSWSKRSLFIRKSTGKRSSIWESGRKRNTIGQMQTYRRQSRWELMLLRGRGVRGLEAVRWSFLRPKNTTGDVEYERQVPPQEARRIRIAKGKMWSADFLKSSTINRRVTTHQRISIFLINMLAEQQLLYSLNQKMAIEFEEFAPSSEKLNKK